MVTRLGIKNNPTSNTEEMCGCADNPWPWSSCNGGSWWIPGNCTSAPVIMHCGCSWFDKAEHFAQWKVIE